MVDTLKHYMEGGVMDFYSAIMVQSISRTLIKPIVG